MITYLPVVTKVAIRSGLPLQSPGEQPTIKKDKDKVEEIAEGTSGNDGSEEKPLII
jgi:hypothetical protein